MVLSGTGHATAGITGNVTILDHAYATGQITGNVVANSDELVAHSLTINGPSGGRANLTIRSSVTLAGDSKVAVTIEGNAVLTSPGADVTAVASSTPAVVSTAQFG